jgi:hypothetical protein
MPTATVLPGERLFSRCRDQARDRVALRVGVAMIDRDQQAIDPEAIDEDPLQLGADRVRLVHADLDQPVGAGAGQQPADLGARHGEAPCQFLLGHVLVVIQGRDLDQGLDPDLAAILIPWCRPVRLSVHRNLVCCIAILRRC